MRGSGHSARSDPREDGRLLPRAPGLLDLEEGAQSAVERRGSTGNQRGLQDFKQFLLGGAEAYGPLHVGRQFPLGIDVSPRHLHARDQLLRLCDSVVVAHIVFLRSSWSEAFGSPEVPWVV